MITSSRPLEIGGLVDDALLKSFPVVTRGGRLSFSWLMALTQSCCGLSVACSIFTFVLLMFIECGFFTCPYILLLFVSAAFLLLGQIMNTQLVRKAYLKLQRDKTLRWQSGGVTARAGS